MKNCLYLYIVCNNIIAVQFLSRYFRLLLSYMSLLSILTIIILNPIIPKKCGERILAFCCYVLTTFWFYDSSSKHIYSGFVVAMFYTFWLRFSSIHPNINVSNRLVPYTDGRCMPYINKRGIFLWYR